MEESKSLACEDIISLNDIVKRWVNIIFDKEDAGIIIKSGSFNYFIDRQYDGAEEEPDMAQLYRQVNINNDPLANTIIDSIKDKNINVLFQDDDSIVGHIAECVYINKESIINLLKEVLSKDSNCIERVD